MRPQQCGLLTSNVFVRSRLFSQGGADTSPKQVSKKAGYMDRRILIVDDEDSVASMLKVVFESEGFAVTTAGSAAQASQLVGAQTFDVVLTDMKMETDAAGFDVVRAVRERSQRTVVVILTAFPLLAQDWRDAGADAALSKPSHMARLLATVTDLLQQRRQSSTGLS
jgi:DNA-binding response OmpR family regulator